VTTPIPATTAETAATPGTASILWTSSSGSSIGAPRVEGTTVMWAFPEKIRFWMSCRRPLIRASEMVSAMTPTATPATEMNGSARRTSASASLQVAKGDVAEGDAGPDAARQTPA
jgi:hypothetical protein